MSVTTRSFTATSTAQGSHCCHHARVPANAALSAACKPVKDVLHRCRLQRHHDDEEGEDQWLYHFCVARALTER